MSNTNTNSMAAILSLAVRVIFWLAVIVGVLGAILIGMGVFGILEDGSTALPGVEIVVESDENGTSTGEMLIAFIALPIFAFGIAYVCRQLQYILGTLATGDPFVPENASRLTRIAIAIGLIEVMTKLAAHILWRVLHVGGLKAPELNINLAAWGAVIVLFVLAQVFREGTRLREQEKMTI